MKQATFNIADFGVTTCSFYDLEMATSVVSFSLFLLYFISIILLFFSPLSPSLSTVKVLLPVSICITMHGPLDNILSMDINGSIQNISLKLSPPIVRLIIHAVKTLTAVTVRFLHVHVHVQCSLFIKDTIGPTLPVLNTEVSSF